MGSNLLESLSDSHGSNLIAEWIHFTLFGIIVLVPTIKLKVYTFGGLMNSATEVNMALGILGGIYELRLFYPLGLPLGSNLVPIMRAAQTSQFMAMLILLMLGLC